MNKAVNDRIKEFVRYHIDGDGECNNVVLKKYCDNHGFNVEQRGEVAYFFAITYCVSSALFLYYAQPENSAGLQSWVDNNKCKVLFQSDRKYMGYADRFEKLLEWYYLAVKSNTEAFILKHSKGNVLQLKEAVTTVQKWYQFGRFAAFLYLETLAYLEDLKTDRTTIDWNNGDTATSGLMNLFGYDNSADYYDKHNRLPANVSKESMDKMFSYILDAVKAEGGEDNATMVETSLCAYRKFYKGTRYNGYYLDRMLEEINRYREQMPEVSAELIKIRQEAFDKEYLGELNDWHGIRKEMKKYYKENGVIN